MSSRTRVTLVLDPRFSGGTCSAVAAEIGVLADIVDLRVVALDTRMFKGRTANPRLVDAMDAAGLALEWDPPVIRGEVVVLHNPSCLKFDRALPSRIVCDRLVVVTHENLLTPTGSEGFDVALCLDLIERAALCRTRSLVPVSAYNRRTVTDWLAAQRPERRWTVAPEDWFNICAFERVAPTLAPRDRRGRLSRPGFEKFPAFAAMQRHFPPHAEVNAILGGDALLLEPDGVPAHWTVLPFGAAPVDEFLDGIDFFVYFTNPLWRESFGRVIAEAIAAGKVVITDPGTGATFGDAVVASDGTDVDAIIEGFVADPARYGAFVRAAQASLDRFGPDAFAARAGQLTQATEGMDLALL